MGLQSDDPDLRNAAINRQRVTTPAGMILDGALDAIEAPPVTGNNGVDPDGDGIANEMPVSLVDFMEFYLLNYFKPATSVSPDGQRGELGPHDLHEHRLHELPHRDADDQLRSPGGGRGHGVLGLQPREPDDQRQPAQPLVRDGDAARSSSSTIRRPTRSSSSRPGSRSS